MKDYRTWYVKQQEICEEILEVLDDVWQDCNWAIEVDMDFDDDTWYCVCEQLWAIREGLAD